MMRLVGMAREAPGTAGWRGYEALVPPPFPKYLSPLKGSKKLGSWSPAEILQVVFTTADDLTVPSGM